MSDSPKCMIQKIIKARKEHKCCECRTSILPKQDYSYTSGIWDDGPLSFRQCLNCHNIFQAAISASDYNEAPCYEDLKEWFFGNMCMNYKGKEFLAGMAEMIKFDTDKLNLLLRVDDRI